MWTAGAEGIGERAIEVYRAGTTGDFAASEGCITDLQQDPSATAKAWVLALHAQRWHAEPGKGSLPTQDALEAFIGEEPSARNAAALACAEVAKAAILAHQIDELEAWARLQERMVEGLSDAWALASSKINRAWSSFARGEVAQAKQFAGEAQAMASQRGIAPAVIEATVIRALCAEGEQDIEEATALARRSSRMARTEDLPQWQYLANVVLARIRRLNGLPHLTTHILRPLLQVAPGSWHAWIAWEGLMSGAIEFGTQIELSDETDPSGEVRHLQGLVDSASQAKSAAFVAAVDSLSAISGLWASRRRDLNLALVALDARVVIADVDEELVAWCRGDEASPPDVITGLCVDLESDRSDPGPAAFVVSGPRDGVNARETRRVAGLGELVVDANARVPRVRGTAERTPTTLAACALAGADGVSRPELFKIVYGFTYDQALHRGLFKSLIHRVRKELGDRGELRVTDDDRYVLELHSTWVIPDPRCEQSLQDIVLRALARSGAQSAREAAELTGIPLRTAQKMLKRLVEGGALIVERVANDVTYRIEDTTFSEPTKWS